MIIGLTDKAPAFPEIGVLRKGAAKPQNGNKPGADLTHFRFDSNDPVAVELFKQIYGDEPRAIRVFAPFATADENFEAWREAWTASSLQHRCDGQMMVRWLTARGTYSDEPKPCTGGCKQVGRLKLIIPELRRLAYVTALTTSIHDILQIHANLKALEGVRGDLRGIPLILRRVPREISTPSGSNGQRARREKWLITLEAQQQWVELQLTAQQQAALPQAQQLALPEWDGEEDEIEEAAPVQTPAPAKGGQAVPAQPKPAPVETAADSLTQDYVERIRSIIADQVKSQEWFAYHAKYVAGKDLAALAALLSRLEIAASKKLIKEIEGPLFEELAKEGISGKEAVEKIAQIADGECGLEAMEYGTLFDVRAGLKAWLGQIQQEASQGVAAGAPF
jgi:hypothetical protein